MGGWALGGTSATEVKRWITRVSVPDDRTLASQRNTECYECLLWQWNQSFTLLPEGPMSDGREEREERERRREWEEREVREGQFTPRSPDPWEPERDES